MNDIKDRIRKVLDSIHKAEFAAGRKEGSVRLMAVSKFHGVQAVAEAANCGQFLFGENRVQEAYEKFEQVKQIVPNVELHIIGSLQRNKVKSAVLCSSCIQSVDRIELLQEIEKQASKQEKKIKILFEFRTGEDTKSGFTSLDTLLKTVEYAVQCEHVIPCGFMTMAPFTDNELVVAASFRKLVGVRHEVCSRFPNLNLKELSMGMSNDYRIAIAEGATMVRIGTAIFGERL